MPRMGGGMTADTLKLLRYAGFVVWGLSGLPLFARLVQDPAKLEASRYWLWLACFAVFGLAFAFTAWPEHGRRARRRQVASLIVQTAAALAMIRLVCSGQEGGLLVIVAAQLGWVLPLWPALVWVFVQAAVMCAILAFSWPTPLSFMLVTTYLGFQVLALFSCFLTAREAGARTELARANRELRATRELLANASRLAERERISRDLHDTVGHHLTALSLNLEAASHLAAGDTLTQVERARATTKLLLCDVRDVVSALRNDDPIRLGDALRTLVAAVPEPAIHLALPQDLAIRDPLHAHTVLRCVQEMVTNTIRHADAKNLWIELIQTDGEMTIRAHDDGCGVREVRPGHGLTGMRERLELVGGHLEIDSQPSRGFRIHAHMPLPGATT
jgi:signal transduction histidine kinase